MASIERTAYPRFHQLMSNEELRARYALMPEELAFIQRTAKGASSRLTLLVMLKTRQQLGYFPSLRDVPDQVTAFLASECGLDAITPLLDAVKRKTTLHYHRERVRAFLSSIPYSQGGLKRTRQAIIDAAETMSDPADLVNVAIEALVKASIELPAFSTLDRLAAHLRQQVHDRLFSAVTDKLSRGQKAQLNRLLVVPEGESITGFTRIKQSPGTPTIARIREWSDRLDWLTHLINPTPLLQPITHTKIRQFAAEAAAHEISDMRNMNHRARRYTLLLCLLIEARMQTRDDLIAMFLRRMRKTENVAREKLISIQQQHRSMEETLMAAFADILHQAKSDTADDALFGHCVRESLNRYGGVACLQDQYETVSAYHQNNYLPLMWSIHAKHRAALFRLLDLLTIQSTSQDQRLPAALQVVIQHRHNRRDCLPNTIDLGFASERWISFVRRRENQVPTLDRRALEVCVLWHLAEALQTGNLYIEDSQDYGDPRSQLLSLDECQQRLPDYCEALGLPSTASAFAASLRTQLEQVADQVDAGFPDNTELTIGEDGNRISSGRIRQYLRII